MTELDRDRNRFRDYGKPRPYRTDRTCKAKRFFSDEALARASGQLSLQERGNRTSLWVYRCLHCSGWHLTHSNSGAKSLITLESPAQVADF